MSKTLAYQTIERARPLVANMNSWTTGAVARDSDGNGVELFSHLAVRFCAYGALRRAAFDLVGNMRQAEDIALTAAVALTSKTSLEPGAKALFTINDNKGQQAIVDLFDSVLHHNLADA